MRRFILLFCLTLAVLLGIQVWRSLPALPERVATQPPAELGVRTVEETAPFVWWEAEDPAATNFPNRNPFNPGNDAERAVLSGDRWIGTDGDRTTPLFLEYQVQISDAHRYHFYSRKFWKHGPFRWRWDNQPWHEVSSNPFLMDSSPIRQFLVANWVGLGTVDLTAGPHTLRIELTQNEGPAAFDCFVLTQSAFQPRGKLKPNQRYTANIPGWFIFDPESDAFRNSPIDLRSLNESFAGENGFIQTRGANFIHEKNGRSERFWAVNINPTMLQMDRADMAYTARFLAKSGVNLVRVHGKLWGDDFRQIDPQMLDGLFAFVAAMKQEGIYTSLSIYFPLWLKLNANDGFGNYADQNPFALLYFNPDFQAVYNGWWRTLLTTRNPYTGKALRDDPALAMVELVNEDSYFFWTFEPYRRIPSDQMEILERQFGDWLKQKYGSLAAALDAWSVSPAIPNVTDDPDAGRIGIMPPGRLVSARNSPRSHDTARFLTESQKQFYENTIQFLRQDLRARSLIYASNWITANAQILGPLDKYTNTVGDSMDHHGYFVGPHEGARASFSLSPNDVYQDRSALLFTSFKDDQPNDFSLPLMDTQYNDLPSTITELNWSMPNRYRADLPLLAAAYGSLQGTDGFFFFATGSQSWMGLLDKFAIASPSILGQFPAAALIYRQGLVKPGESIVDIALNIDNLLHLKGAPISAPQNLDEFRAQDVPPGQTMRSAPSSIDPLAFLVGQVKLRFTDRNDAYNVTELSPYINRSAKTIRSTTQELFWDYGNGLVTLNAPKAQGATGFLKKAGELNLGTLHLNSDLDYGTVMLVALDNQLLSQSRKMLLQVMSADENFGWRTSGSPRKTIESIGSAPLVVQNLTGQVSLNRGDARSLKVTALDFNGYPQTTLNNASSIPLQPNTFYYLIEK